MDEKDKYNIDELIDRIPLPQPDEIPKKEKEDAMGAYLMMFASWALFLPLPFIGLIAALIYHALNAKKSRFVAFHSYQSLLSELVLTVFNTILIVWSVILIVRYFSDSISPGYEFWVYLWFCVLWNIVYMSFSIYAAVKAKQGRFVYFWIFGPIAYNKYYGKAAVDRLKKEREKQDTEINRPPV